VISLETVVGWMLAMAADSMQLEAAMFTWALGFQVHYNTGQCMRLQPGPAC
jgi:predicted peroxiredoxin